MKFILILIVIILSLYTPCHALTDYQLCGGSKICWIDMKCHMPGAPTLMTSAGQHVFKMESALNCPLFIAIRPYNLKKWQIEMMDKNTTMQEGVGLKRGKAGDVFMCKENKIGSRVDGVVISDETFINDTNGGVHCIFNVSVEHGLISKTLHSYGKLLYYFQNVITVQSLTFSDVRFTGMTPCSDDYDCAKDEECSPPKKNENGTKLICGPDYEFLYNDGNGNWTAVAEPVACEGGLYQINSTSLSQNVQFKCARKKETEKIETTEKSDNNEKSDANSDGPPYTLIICIAVSVAIILIVIGIVFGVCWFKRRKAKAAGNTAPSVNSELGGETTPLMK